MNLRTLTYAALLLPAAVLGDQRPPADTHLGHTRHHHAHGGKLPVEKTSPARYVTSREGAAALLLPEEKDAFQFAVFGDRTGGPAEGVDVLADAVRDTNLLAPDLVMTVGDLVQGYNQGNEWVAQADEYKGIMEKLSCPWFPVAGNHDTYWRGKAGGVRPERENESLFETHFGPLWYAFEHKNCWFIVLYSDEGVSEAGVKDFKSPVAQRMSEAQFGWLRETLAKAAGADHIFLFLHHPRWIGDIPHGGYGDDWKRVHELLRSAGNVSAVFGGHIHQMRSDGPRDGIEYITLATTGGHVPGQGEAMGYLHHYHVVTVRKQGISLAAIPVGEVLDPREMTGRLVAETTRFGEQEVKLSPEVRVEADGSASSRVVLEFANPTSRPVDYVISAGSADSRWAFAPDHVHGTLAPGAKATPAFHASRVASAVDETFRDPVLTLEAGYLAEGYRYAMPPRALSVPLAFDADAHGTAVNRALRFDGGRDFLSVPSKAFDPGGTFTLECRFKADSFGKRTGLVTKMQGSDYGILVSNGEPAFSVFIGDSYLTAKAREVRLEPQRWHHVAGVYDGREARLYLDGKLVAAAARQGTRKRNTLPLVIGGDVDAGGAATSHFRGLIDYVRISRSPRYTGNQTAIPARVVADEQTCLMLDMDAITGQRVLDTSASKAHADRRGSPSLAPLD